MKIGVLKVKGVVEGERGGVLSYYRPGKEKIKSDKIIPVCVFFYFYADGGRALISEKHNITENPYISDFTFSNNDVGGTHNLHSQGKIHNVPLQRQKDGNNRKG